jgi:hypothetical protein
MVRACAAAPGRTIVDHPSNGKEKESSRKEEEKGCRKEEEEVISSSLRYTLLTGRVSFYKENPASTEYGV